MSMARIAAPRLPAEPTARSQVVRRERILRSAAELGARHGFDGVQMQHVARDAGVALGTVYRYFPSKTQLFVAVMAEEVFADQPGPGPLVGADGAGEVAAILAAWAHRFTRRPELARAMVRSTLAVYAGHSAEARLMDFRAAPLILSRLGIDQPTAADLSRIRLLLYAWWGIVISRLSEHMTQAEAEEHIQMGAALLVAGAQRPA
jgi:AcrR family transcriptional regulator